MLPGVRRQKNGQKTSPFRWKATLTLDCQNFDEWNYATKRSEEAPLEPFFYCKKLRGSSCNQKVASAKRIREAFISQSQNLESFLMSISRPDLFP